MTAINFSAKGAAATAEKIGILTEGMVGVPVSFSFDSAWDGLNIIAVFRCGGVVKDRVLIGTNQTTVPWEVLKRQGLLEIGAEGRSADGSVVIPTVWARVGQILPGANASADPGLEPSPAVYDEIMSAMGNLNALQTKTKESLVAAINELVEAGASLQANINEGGHLILTLPNGNTIDAGYAVGPPGADGDDGITPHIGDNGNWWLGEVDTGVSAHGYTPVKGEDYWTEADKQEIVEGVIADVGADDSVVGNKAWSSKNTVDKLCPAFAVSGSVVTCEPVEGYPLTVQTDEGATKVTRCGLNIWDEQWRLGIIYNNGGLTYNTKTNIMTENFIPVKSGVKLRIYAPQMIRVIYYDTNKVVVSYSYPKSGDVITPAQDGYIKFCMGDAFGSQPAVTEYGNNICISINNGNEPVYEPYRGEDFAPGAPIPALDGINTIFADSGEITVSGRADPTVIIKDLCNKVNALSATVTALTGV